MRLAEDSKCFGCGACVDACAHGAISFAEKRGFYYPIIDESKCVGCGKCTKVCPSIEYVENEAVFDTDPMAWAAWAEDEELRVDSTSGGMFGVIAKHYLEQGNYVCGAVFSDDFRTCHHIVTNRLEDLPRMMHSKYFQSDLRGVYKKIRELLGEGKKIMFCGTPCQTAGLFKYCDGADTEKLLLVDVFCKGVPSPVVHKKYIEQIEKENSGRITGFHPKHKIKGWGKILTKVDFDNGKTIYLRSKLDPLFVTERLDVRSACAECKYKGLDRVADISIGDYWGVTGISQDELKKGVSAVVANTVKGQETLTELGKKIHKEKRSVFDVSNKRNPGYSQNIILSERYNEFYDDLERMPFASVLRKYAVNNGYLAILLRKIGWVWSKVKNIDLFKFVYINFLCRHVERGKHAYIIPGSRTIFDFSKGSKLIVERGINLINYRKPHGSKEEAWIQLGENATMLVHHELDMRNCRFVVQKDAVLEIDKLEMNGRCNVVARKKIKIGYGVMIARNVTIYDSDYHPFSIGDNIQKVVSKPVEIKDRVWIANDATITKGVVIGEGAVVSTKSLVMKNVKPHTMVSGNPAKEVCGDVYWAQ